jgi:hypothetical protein
LRNMKKLSLAVLLLLFVGVGYAQIPANSVSKVKSDTPFFINDPIEIIPSYPGGDDELFKYIRENYHFPQGTKNDGIHTKIVTGFIVNVDGSISEIKILRSAGELMDKEAIRIIKAMPKWKPGMLNGKPQPMRYILPIQLELSE